MGLNVARNSFRLFGSWKLEISKDKTTKDKITKSPNTQEEE
jgi:hypothetical protein